MLPECKAACEVDDYRKNSTIVEDYAVRNNIKCRCRN